MIEVYRTKRESQELILDLAIREMTDPTACLVFATTRDDSVIIRNRLEEEKITPKMYVQEEILVILVSKYEELYDMGNFNYSNNEVKDNIRKDIAEELDCTVSVQQVPYVVLFMGEFLATAILMYIGCMGCVLEFPGGPILPAFAFGFSILAAVQVVGHITGCHMNPAISLGILILGKMDWKELLVYLPAQYLGAMAGYAALKVMMPSGYQICVLKLAYGVTLIQAFFIEFTVTFVLMLVVAGSMDTKNSMKIDSSPLRIGLTVSGFIFAASPFTSAALNPARSLPPSLLNNHWDYHWIFHVGPFLGSMTAAFVYRYIFEENESYSIYKLAQKRK